MKIPVRRDLQIVARARRLERKIARSLEAAVGEFVGTPVPAAIEIIHAVVDAAEQRIEEVGRGRRVFPFNRIVVHLPIAARDKEARARFAAVADGPPSLAQRVTDRLDALGCRAQPISTELVFSPKARSHWTSPEYHIEFESVEVRRHVPPPRHPVRLKLTVGAGQAERRAYVFNGGRIDIGRRAEVLDARQRLVRVNHVAFTDEGGDVNETVSRRHAHIVYADDAHEYRLSDDRSLHGTAIVRNGRTIPVPSGPRGTRLQAGDEILCGGARLRVALEVVEARADES